MTGWERVFEKDIAINKSKIIIERTSVSKNPFGVVDVLREKKPYVENMISTSRPSSLLRNVALQAIEFFV